MASRLVTIARHLRSNGKVTRRGLMTGPMWFEQCTKIKVLDSYMSYYDSENYSENAVVLLHGNPTSSYLWRNIIPHITGIARCLAPDLIGMGQSGKSGNGLYRFVDHYKYLSAWFDLVNLPEKIIIVCHDWGSALGFHWCHQNSAQVKAIVHMESLVSTIKSWNNWPEIARDIFQTIQSEKGEELILKKNMFINQLLPLSILRGLTQEELDAYNLPYQEEGESRRPHLSWAREIPVEGEGPEDVIKIVSEYHDFMAKSDIPKLFIEAEPGFFSKAIKKIALQWPNTSTVKVDGLHFLQEDSPDAIGTAIHSFSDKLL